MVPKGEVTGRQLCLILFEQGVLDYDDDTYARIANGNIVASSFILEKSIILRLLRLSWH